MTRMDKVRTYDIEIQGKLEEQQFNPTSPLQVTVVRTDAAATRFWTRTDQAGLIGLIRHLHGWGFVILSVRAANQVSRKG